MPEEDSHLSYRIHSQSHWPRLLVTRVAKRQEKRHTDDEYSHGFFSRI